MGGLNLIVKVIIQEELLKITFSLKIIELMVDMEYLTKKSGKELIDPYKFFQPIRGALGKWLLSIF